MLFKVETHKVETHVDTAETIPTGVPTRESGPWRKKGCIILWFICLAALLAVPAAWAAEK
jgi:hypothetical protein